MTNKDKWETVEDNERISDDIKNQYKPPLLSDTATLYLNAVYKVSRFWERSPLGEIMYLNMKDIEEESKYHEIFDFLTLENVKWALETYEEITLYVKQQNNNNTTSKN